MSPEEITSIVDFFLHLRKYKGDKWTYYHKLFTDELREIETDCRGCKIEGITFSQAVIVMRNLEKERSWNEPRRRNRGK